MGKRLERAARVVALCLLAASVVAVWGRPRHAGAAATPIDHVVVIMMENRTFDNVLGALCVERVAVRRPRALRRDTDGAPSWTGARFP